VQTSLNEIEVDKQFGEFVSLDDLSILEPLEKGSKLNREISGVVC